MTINKTNEVRLSPQHAKAYEQALFLHKSGNLKQSLVIYQVLIQIYSDHSDINHSLAVLLNQIGKIELALKHFQIAVEGNKSNPTYLTNYGLLLSSSGKLTEAREALSRLVELNPNSADAAFNLANVEFQDKRFDVAVELYEKSLETKPNFIGCLHNYAGALQTLCRIDETIATRKRIVEISNRSSTFNSAYLFSLNYSSRLDAQDVYREHIAVQNWPPRNQYKPLKYSSSLSTVRVGFVSADFYAHSVAYFLLAYFKNYDRTRFEIYCYSNGEKSDEITQELKSRVYEWRQIQRLDTNQTISIIKSDKIDVLVDLSGHTKNNRLDVFAKRAAPIQVTWLGYPNTTGVPNIDYRIVDEISDPETKQEKLNSEDLIFLENGFLCYTGDEQVETSEMLPCTEKGYFTFGSFNNLLKVNELVIDTWAEILASVPSSRMIIKSSAFDQDSVKRRYLELFQSYGISESRLTLMGRIDSQKDHLELYHQIDLCLDTFPYNGTTTTCEALWMGVPTVTFVGDRHASRVGASLMTHSKLERFIAPTREDYIQLAVSIAKDTELLQGFRKELRNQIQSSDLCNGKLFSKNLEKAFEQMLERTT